jgi:hypothetical protein
MQVVIVVLERSAAVTVAGERAAASQHSGVASSVVEDICYIDVVLRLFHYYCAGDISSKASLRYYLRRLASREFSSTIPSTEVKSYCKTYTNYISINLVRTHSIKSRILRETRPHAMP